MSINAFRVQQIRDSLDVEKQLGRSAEQVARNLFHMLAEAGNIKKVEILAGFYRGFGQAQKKLDEVTIPPDIAPEALERRLRRLQKKSRRYVQIAESWAAKMNRDPDDALLRLFDGTDYGADRQVDEDGYDPHAMIAAALRRIAFSVINGADLTTFWDRLLATPGRYDPRFQRILLATQPLVDVIGGLRGAAICTDEMSPIASVRLLRRRQQDEIPGSLWFSEEPEPDDFHPASSSQMPYLSPVAFSIDDEGRMTPCLPTSQDGSKPEIWDLTRMQHRNVTFSHWLDIRLAVGPHASSDDAISSNIGPLIELRTMIEAKMDDELVQFDNPYHDGTAIVRWAKLRGRWHRAHINTLDGPLPVRVSNSYFDMPEHSWFAWGELSAASLQCAMGDDLLPSAKFSWADHEVQEPGASVDVLLQELQAQLRGDLASQLLEQALALRDLVRRHRADIRGQFESETDATLFALAARIAALQSDDEDFRA